MNKHLKLVRELRDALALPQAEHRANIQLSEMDIILAQALLMDGGSEVLKALKAGEMVEILSGLVDLAYYALGAIALQGMDVVDRPSSWEHDGHVVSIMRLLSEKINNCSTGSIDDYSEVYSLCILLARRFLNADFDKAFQAVHDSNISELEESSETALDSNGKFRKTKLFKTPDLSDCLYE